MPVYEAKNLLDFRKLVRFVKAQPEDCIERRCWENVWKFKTAEEYLNCIETTQWHFFIAEDDKKKIRAIGSIRLQPHLIVGNFQWRAATALIDHEDWEANNLAYFTEMIIHVARLGVTKLNVSRWESSACQAAFKPFQTVFGELLKVLETRENPQYPELGLFYTFEIDMREYAKKWLS